MSTQDDQNDGGEGGYVVPVVSLADYKIGPVMQKVMEMSLGITDLRPNWPAVDVKTGQEVLPK